jgi:hypothetical protein
MSHAGSWRASCGITIHFQWFHFETPSVARGVTDPGVGSGALLARFPLSIEMPQHSEAFFHHYGVLLLEAKANMPIISEKLKLDAMARKNIVREAKSLVPENILCFATRCIDRTMCRELHSNRHQLSNSGKIGSAIDASAFGEIVKLT